MYTRDIALLIRQTMYLAESDSYAATLVLVHPNLRLLGLFRASRSHNPVSIRIPVGLLPHFILIEMRIINSISRPFIDFAFSP